MKKIIPWVCAVVFAAAAYFFYGQSNSNVAELTKAHEELQEVEKLRADNAELRKLPDQAAEIERLTKDNAELLRLRNEVQQLRSQTKQMNTELSKAQSASEQAQTRQQQIAAEMQRVRESAAQQQAQALLQQATPNAPLTPAEQQSAVCIQHLRQLAFAKQQWALEFKKSATDLPTAADLSPYVPNLAGMTCPNGGTYTINAVGLPTTCTVQGHTLNPINPQQ